MPRPNWLTQLCNFKLIFQCIDFSIDHLSDAQLIKILDVQFYIKKLTNLKKKTS